MGQKFLHKAYDGSAEDAPQDLYDAWAETYDREIAENGYASPRRCARALADCLPDNAAVKLLDMGCGTGLSGLAFRAEGIEHIDGMDISPEMLNRARDTGAYTSLRQIAIGELPVTEGDYDAISAVGVIGPGHAPPEFIDQVLSVLAPGGLFVFSINEAAMQDPVYDTHIDAHLAGKTAHLLFREFGDHLPGHDLKSTVFVLQKA